MNRPGPHSPAPTLMTAAAAAAILAPASAEPAVLLPWLVLLVGLVVLAVLAAHFADILILSFLWLAVTSVLSFEFWTLDVPGFFNLTIDRVAIVALVMVFAVGLVIGRFRLQWPGKVGVLLGALVAWMAVSAQMHGWQLPPGAANPTVPLAPPYYRFFVGYLLPAGLFVLAVSGVRRERQLSSTLWFFTVFGAYLTVTGLAEHFAIPWLVWPRYILDPTRGIHVGRVRGPFLNAPDMGLTLLACLFANLLLMARGGAARRLLLLALSLPIPVIIFWTYTRSVWLAATLCVGVAIWFWPRNRSVARALSLVAMAAGIVLVAGFWSNLSSPRREAGGVAEEAPVITRIELAKVSFELIRDHPLTGVGLARFNLAAQKTSQMTRAPFRTAEFARQSIEHNNVLGLLAETGLPGAALYVALLVSLLAVSVRLYRLLPPTALGALNRRFVVFYWLFWVNYFMDAMFRQTVSSPFPNSMFLLLSGIIVGLSCRLRPQPLPPRAGPALPPASSRPAGPSPEAAR